MNRLHTPDQFRSRPARVIVAVVGLVLAYFVMTRAFDTGSWWQYFGTILLLVLSIRLIVKAIKNKK